MQGRAMLSVYASGAALTAAFLGAYPVVLAPKLLPIAYLGIGGLAGLAAALIARRAHLVYFAAALFVLEYATALTGGGVGLDVLAPLVGVCIYALTELVALAVLERSGVVAGAGVRSTRAGFGLLIASLGAVIAGFEVVLGASVPAAGAVALALAGGAAALALLLPVVLARAGSQEP